MKPISVRSIIFEEITVLDKPALFTTYRIDPNTVPEGLYQYEVREIDCSGIPCEIKKHILVNFFGTVIFAEDLGINDNNPEIILSMAQGETPYITYTDEDTGEEYEDIDTEALDWSDWDFSSIDCDKTTVSSHKYDYCDTIEKFIAKYKK